MIWIVAFVVVFALLAGGFFAGWSYRQRSESVCHPLRLLLMRACVMLNWAAYRMQSGTVDERAAADSRSMVQEIKKAIKWEPDSTELFQFR